MSRPLGRSLGTLVACTAIAVAFGAPGAEAQSGVDGSVIAGAALGAYSGGAVALVGSLLPCNRTLLGPGCAAAGGLAGAAIGIAAGGSLGTAGDAEVRDRARGALYGAAIGGVAGAVLQHAVRQYAWNDALLVAAYGAAVGAAPRGSLIGAGIGAAAGSLLWASPQGGLADLVMLTVVGSALGGLYDWVDGAVRAGEPSEPLLVTSFSIVVG